MLLLENADPLLMDPPEDNLDNAFIAERIVTELREAKSSRQFLFATHNANIPVNGQGFSRPLRTKGASGWKHKARLTFL